MTRHATLALILLLIALPLSFSGCITGLPADQTDAELIIISPSAFETVNANEWVNLSWDGGNWRDGATIEYRFDHESPWKLHAELTSQDIAPTFFTGSFWDITSIADDPDFTQGTDVNIRLTNGPQEARIRFYMIDQVPDLPPPPPPPAPRPLQRDQGWHSHPNDELIPNYYLHYWNISAAGINVEHVTFHWDELYDDQGNLDLTDAFDRIATLKSRGMRLYCSLPIIEGTRLRVPDDLLLSGSDDQLRSDLDFDSDEFMQHLDELQPLFTELINANARYFSFANNIDQWMRWQPQHAEAFGSLVEELSADIWSSREEIETCITFTEFAPFNEPWVKSASKGSAVAVNYRLRDEFNVMRDPNRVEEHLDALVDGLGTDKPILLERVSCSSGYAMPGNGSSEEIQRGFWTRFMASFRTNPAFTYFGAADIRDAEAPQVAERQAYWNDTSALFTESEATSGLWRHDGSDKPAWGALQEGLAKLRR